METLTKEFELPSQGLFGGPKKVTVRPMTTREEKMLYTTKDSTYLDKIVKSCIVEPSDCSLDNLHAADITYLLFMIREMTFGPNYKQNMQCPYCNHQQLIEIDITEMANYLLDFEELEKYSTIELPICGDTIKIKLLSNKNWVATIVPCPQIGSSPSSIKYLTLNLFSVFVFFKKTLIGSFNFFF